MKQYEKTIKQFIDKSNHYRAFIMFDDGSTAMLKFDTEPTQEEIENESVIYANLELVEVVEPDQEQELLEELENLLNEIEEQQQEEQ